MKIFSSFASLDRIRGSLLSPMLRGIIIRILGHCGYSPENYHVIVYVDKEHDPVTTLTY